MIRTLNQRRLEGAKSIDQLAKGQVSGRVVKSGFHDELGGSPFVVVKAADGHELYARMGVGKVPPAVGKTITLSLNTRGFAQLVSDKGADLSR